MWSGPGRTACRSLPPQALYSLLLNFDPMRTSDGNNYTCTATVNVTDVVTVSGEESTVVVVSSK